MRTSPERLIEAYRQQGWWSDRRLFDLFDTAVAATPATLALVDAPNRSSLAAGQPLRLSFADTADLVDRLAFALLTQGLNKGDVLVTQLPNIAEYPALYLAAMKLGIVISPVPMQFRAHEIGYILELTGARAMLTVGRFKGEQHASLLQDGFEARAARLLCLDGEGPAGSELALPSQLDSNQQQALEAAIAGARVDADDIATLCWTSGTEGRPKAVPRSHNHWLSIGDAHLIGVGIREGEKLLSPFPFVNMAAIGGCLISWLHSRGTLIMHHPLDLPIYLRQIAEERADYAIAPPAVLSMLIRDEALLARADLSSLRCIGSGSAPLDPAMIRGFQDRFGIEVVNLFGSNEGISLISNAANIPDPARRARLFPRYGRSDLQWDVPSPAVIQTRLIDPDDGSEVMEAGRRGEMQVKGPTVFDGYLHAPEINARVFTEDGWFRTGDLFELEGEPGDLRYYRFVGRLGQVINRGGLKISPEEIDSVLAGMASIQEAATTSYPDPVLGERVCAVVVPKAGQAVTLADVSAHFHAAGVAVYKHPERVVCIEQLPRNSTGKVIPAEIARIAASGD
ncbi:MAG: class I adenylate-forming enzyme family protein [Steroidobacteraceae bacterium]